MSAHALLRRLRAQLEDAGIEDPRGKSAAVYERVFGARPAHEVSEPQVSPDQRALFDALAQKVLSGYPVQYILGRWPFLDFELEIGEGVLIPRSETESVALTALEYLQNTPGAALDLCAGSGAIAIALRRRGGAAVTALEKYPAAFEYLKRNAAALAPGMDLVSDDVFGAEKRLPWGHFALIVSNPPYVCDGEWPTLDITVKTEPRTALCGGTDGMDFYRYIAANYRDNLSDGGALVFETGDAQNEAVAVLLRECGYVDIHRGNDCFGMPRVVSARRGK